MSHLPKHEIADRVETVVEVVELLSAESATVRLPNGREVYGYLGETANGVVLAAGQRVKAWLFVADFSRAELRGN
jgi:hypothetical protein